MPYYKCPKCGSKDSYSGTEIVSEHKHKTGHMIAGPENALGMTPVMNVGGSSRTEHKEMSVQKCRKCDCLLGEKDSYYTEEEKLYIIESERRDKEREERVNRKTKAFRLKFFKAVQLWVLILISFHVLVAVLSFFVLELSEWWGVWVLGFSIWFIAPLMIWRLWLRHQ